MEIKVYWTDTALNNLEDIFEYHKHKASVQLAKKLVKGLVKNTLRLQKSPYLGKKEEFLVDRDYEYRFIIAKNYKIIY
jgi:toxin ParE1/3/4